MKLNTFRSKALGSGQLATFLQMFEGVGSSLE